MGEKRGTKGLELWCRRMTEGYTGVKVENMTSSWRDGLAFCAIIHHFRPDLIDFSKLKKDDVYYNNELAFRIAERHLGIPALLEPADMVKHLVPDRLSILTYLSQFYQVFTSQGISHAKKPTVKRPSDIPDADTPSTSSTSIPEAPIGKIRRDPCIVCNLPVFLAERLNVGKSIYHRTCFRCARCRSQLTPASYYETDQGDYCCEICPDEENILEQYKSNIGPSSSLSDDEKSTEVFKENLDQVSVEAELNSAHKESHDALTYFMQSQLENKKTEMHENSTVESLASFSHIECDTSTNNENTNSFRQKDYMNSTLNNSLEAFDEQNLEISSSIDENSKAESECHKFVTKDLDIGVESSLVRKHLEMFESLQSQNNFKYDEDKKGDNLISKNIDSDHESDSVRETDEKCNNINSDYVSKIPNTVDPNLNKHSDDHVDANVSSIEENSVEVIVTKPTHQVNDDVIYPTSLNPFGEDDNDLDNEMENIKCLNPFDVENLEEDSAANINSSKISKHSLNPFGSDEESDENSVNSFQTKQEFHSRSVSVTQRIKKKKTAPKPPTSQSHQNDDSDMSETSSLKSYSSSSTTPVSMPKYRKVKKAPLPPSLNSLKLKPTPIQRKLIKSTENKVVKDQVNKTVQQHISMNKPDFDSDKNESSKSSRYSSDSNRGLALQDKSTQGKWKRRKGQAPSIPVPLKRMVKPLPLSEINKELEMIETQQLGLERQGVKLEEMIRDRSEAANPDETLPQDVEDMILQLFELVNEKNELFRKQAELMYCRRQQRLEEEQAEIEYRIRCLMLQPEGNATDSDKEKEEELIARLVEIVERRNEIIDCLERDRLREAEEDNAISSELNLFTLKRDEQTSTPKKMKPGKKLKKKLLGDKKTSTGKSLDNDVGGRKSPKKIKSLKKKFNIF